MKSYNDKILIHFAWLPTKLISGELVWLKEYKELVTYSERLKRDFNKDYFSVEKVRRNHNYEKYENSEKFIRVRKDPLFWHYCGGRAYVNDPVLQGIIVCKNMNEALPDFSLSDYLSEDLLLRCEKILENEN